MLLRIVIPNVKCRCLCYTLRSNFSSSRFSSYPASSRSTKCSVRWRTCTVAVSAIATSSPKICSSMFLKVSWNYVISDGWTLVTFSCNKPDCLVQSYFNLTSQMYRTFAHVTTEPQNFASAFHFTAPLLVVLWVCCRTLTSLDVWSGGCVMAELLMNRPIFRGSKSSDQMEKIMRVDAFVVTTHLLTFIGYWRSFSNRSPCNESWLQAAIDYSVCS